MFETSFLMETRAQPISTHRALSFLKRIEVSPLYISMTLSILLKSFGTVTVCFCNAIISSMFLLSILSDRIFRLMY